MVDLHVGNEFLRVGASYQLPNVGGILRLPPRVMETSPDRYQIQI